MVKDTKKQGLTLGEQYFRQGEIRGEIKGEIKGKIKLIKKLFANGLKIEEISKIN